MINLEETYAYLKKNSLSEKNIPDVYLIIVHQKGTQRTEIFRL